MSSPTLTDLILAYQNEKSTRRLLPYASRPVDHFLAIVSKRTESIGKLDRSVVKNIYELEAERVKFLLKEYIQTRLRKISADLYVDKTLLSGRESIFYESYLGLLKERDVYVEKQRLNKTNEFVGFYCLVDVYGVMIDGEPLEMLKGDFFVAPLDDVADLVKKNEIVLF